MSKSIGGSVMEFWSFNELVTVTAGTSRTGFICRSDAVCLDMEIFEADGVVAIDFERGETDA